VVVFIGLSKFLSVNYFKSEQAVPLLLIFSVYIVVSMLTGIFYSILHGFQDVKWYSISESVRLGVTLAVFFPLWFGGLGILAPAFAFLAGISATFVVLMIGSLKYRYLLKFKIEGVKEAIKGLVKFAIPVIFQGVGGRVIGHLDVLILTFFLGLTEVGIYNAILPTALIFMFFAKAISNILFPMASELWQKDDKQKLSEGLRLIYSYSMVALIPIVLAAFVFADVFIGKLFGEEFLPGVTAFRILLLGVLCFMITSNNNAVLSGIGYPLKVTKVTLIAAGLNVVLNIILIPKFEIEGAAIATAASYILMLIMSTYEVRKLIKVISPWKIWLKGLFAGLVFAGSLYYLRGIIDLGYWLDLLFALIGGVVIYLLLIYLFGLVNIREIKRVLRQVRK
jgi:O-antigen/teichoic acid export membrane protein